MVNRGRPASTASRLLDVTALALDLPGWDNQELQLICCVAYQVRAVFLRTEDPDIKRLCKGIICNLETWTRGDRRENGHHDVILQTLRELNGRMEQRLAGAA